MRNISIAMLAGLSLLSAAQAQQAVDPDRISPSAKYSQSDAVRARFPDIAIQLTAPSLVKSPRALTSHGEMVAFIRSEISNSPRAAVIDIGVSQQGRSIPAILLSREGRKDLAEARGLNRPVVWFIGQQHGNEPAGGEAMLALAHKIAHGSLASLLDDMTVVIVPRANPDGAEADKRNAASGADLNRDHILLTQAEIRAIHTAMQALPPDVVFDHHEFSVANRWAEKFNGVQKADAMLLSATHPMIAADIRTIADDLFQTRVEAALARHALTPFTYVTTSYSRKDPLVSTGGTAPGIARNAFGLAGAVSYLVETRGVGIGLENWQRRVATHVVIAEAVLQAVKEGGAPLAARLASARKSVAASSTDLPVGAKLRQSPVPMPLIDPVTGQDKVETVALQDSRALTITATRRRPIAYLVTTEQDETEQRLRMNGVRTCRLARPIDIEVESYRIAAPPKAANREAINPEQTVNVAIQSAKRAIPAGALYLPTAQAAAGILSAAMEPDSPGSLVGTGLLALKGDLAPVHRLMAGNALPADALDATCR